MRAQSPYYDCTIRSSFRSAQQVKDDAAWSVAAVQVLTVHLYIFQIYFPAVFAQQFCCLIVGAQNVVVPGVAKIGEFCRCAFDQFPLLEMGARKL